jgi:hypothetical protein
MRAPCPVHMSSRDMLKHYFSPTLRLALTIIGLHIVELHTHIAAMAFVKSRLGAQQLSLVPDWIVVCQTLVLDLAIRNDDVARTLRGCFWTHSLTLRHGCSEQRCSGLDGVSGTTSAFTRPLLSPSAWSGVPTSEALTVLVSTCGSSVAVIFVGSILVWPCDSRQRVGRSRHRNVRQTCINRLLRWGRRRAVKQALRSSGNWCTHLRHANFSLTRILAKKKCKDERVRNECEDGR